MNNTLETQFNNIFYDIIDRKVAIYGTGNNARLIANNVRNVEFVCVIDENSKESYFCEIPIVKLEDALAISDVILIAAMPTSTSIIYERIKGRIDSGILLYDLRGHNLSSKVDALDDISSLAESSFDMRYTKLLFEEFSRLEDGKIAIKNDHHIAFIIAPITFLFFRYILSYSNDYDFILFPSRDGYYFYQLYKEYYLANSGCAKPIYLYTSREAVLNCDENYEKYIKSLNLHGKCAVIDIVTQGTVLGGISKILNMELDLISMGTTGVPNENISNANRVHSLFGQINYEKDGLFYSFSEFSELHLLLELLYASTDGQFLRFDDYGKPLFKHNEYDARLVMGVQKKLGEIGNRLNYEDDISKNYAMGLLRLFYRSYSAIDDDLKNKFSFDDPYDTNLHNCNLIEKLGW